MAKAQRKKSRPPAHARKKKRSLLPWALLTLVFALAGAIGYYFVSSSLFDKPKASRDEKTSRQTETLLVAKDKATVMIMGVDERADDIGRSDTLMIAAVDPKKKNASLLSIPRDTRVHVPGYGYDKINVAYSLGGHRLTERAVEEFLDMPVDHYVLVKVPAFKRIIDALGGVDIDVEKRMYYVDEWDDDGGLVIDLYPGRQHMDGKTAITYVRYRDEEGDIGRVGRQQKFMRAVMARATSPAVIPRLPNIIREIMSSVETDLSFRQCLELAGAFKEAQATGLRMKMVAGRPLYIDEVSYWIPDLGEARADVADMLGIRMSAEAQRELRRDADAYEASIPDGASEAPDDTDIGTPAPKKPEKEKKTPKDRKSAERTGKGKDAPSGVTRPVETNASDRPAHPAALPAAPQDDGEAKSEEKEPEEKPATPPPAKPASSSRSHPSPSSVPSLGGDVGKGR